jgi:hypothetical protein
MTFGGVWGRTVDDRDGNNRLFQRNVDQFVIRVLVDYPTESVHDLLERSERVSKVAVCAW